MYASGRLSGFTYRGLRKNESKFISVSFDIEFMV